MGDFTLGVLLGEHQSFDPNVGSWEKIDSVGSFDVQLTDVHSSAQGAIYEVFSSTGFDLFQYDYEVGENKKFEGITSHVIDVSFWSRVTLDVASGIVEFDVSCSGLQGRIVFSNSLQLHQLQFTESNSLQLRFIALGLSTDYNLFIDDILPELDQQVLHPNWDYTENEEIIKHLHTTIGGQTSQFKYSNFFKFEIGLFAIPTSQADLINFWWDNKVNLVYRPDTSDSNLVYIVRLVNQSKPLDTFVEVNNPDLLSGRLQLESITSKLVY